MYYINPENTSYYYISGDLESINEVYELNYLDKRIKEVIDILYNSNDTRIVLIDDLFNKEIKNLYFLFWSCEIDLVELDYKIKSKIVIDDDFEDSVKTIHQRTKCPECQSIFNTLIIPHGDPYLGAPDLFMKKYLKSKILNCPICKKSFRQSVVKIINKF